MKVTLWRCGVRFLECFAGQGGWSLGLSRVGMECAGHIEMNSYAQKVLDKRFPGVPLVERIEDVKGDEFGSVDIVCGSPPCQPFSMATHGTRKGKEDDRHLWPQMCRVINIYKPTWVAIENVAAFASMAFGDISSDLEGLGFEVGQPLGIPACAMGKDHIRKRAWIFGYSDSNRKSRLPFHAKTSRVQRGDCQSRSVGEKDGVSSGLERQRLRLIGNSLDPDIVSEIGRNILAVEVLI
jgi:DNA (cytosine-5)-methyltransferase 1